MADEARTYTGNIDKRGKRALHWNTRQRQQCFGITLGTVQMLEKRQKISTSQGIIIRDHAIECHHHWLSGMENISLTYPHLEKVAV
jgi:hypothetical protein